MCILLKILLCNHTIDIIVTSTLRYDANRYREAAVPRLQKPGPTTVRYHMAILTAMIIFGTFPSFAKT